MRRLLFILVIAMLWPASAGALTADELLLIVNKNDPNGVKLATFYAEQRKVPDGRIVEVDLPTWNEIAFEQYQSNVVAPVRQQLRERGLEGKVKCLVTFYGMPLRVHPYTPTKDEQAELQLVTERLAEVGPQLNKVMQEIEALAVRIAPSAIPKDLPADPIRRAEVLLNLSAQVAERTTDRAERRESLETVLDVMEVFSADFGTMMRRRVTDVSPSTRPAGAKDSITLELELLEAQKKLVTHLDAPGDATARAAARETAARFGLPSELGVLRQQQQWLTPSKTASALDNELSLILARGYLRDGWAPNFLHHAAPAYNGPPLLMVSRIDGPSPERTREMIETSIAIEKTGLNGAVAIDAGFNKGNKPFDVYNDSLLNFAQLVQDKTKLSMVLDREGPLMPLHRAKNIALYCGWYSVRKYVPTSKFKPGAVAWHIASFELVTLHDPEETGWARGLLKDGAVATLGAVAEPYLHSFPLPNEFFPLLLTGKLTIAEVYWKTCPLASWMQALVADPLYNPYKVNPALKVADLPESMRKVVGE
ncbi:MAG TPA: TIGR03790 family protein [Tepidisphaeraceae bacterium]|jgi:uncharacterized protein (TIGR03790 family)|nr:TIGR03790 family protein [Tepidisphaeraceae bacterium]